MADPLWKYIRSRVDYDETEERRVREAFRGLSVNTDFAVLMEYITVNFLMRPPYQEASDAGFELGKLWAFQWLINETRNSLLETDAQAKE